MEKNTHVFEMTIFRFTFMSREPQIRSDRKCEIPSGNKRGLILKNKLKIGMKQVQT